MIEIVRAESWLARRRFYLFSHKLYRGDPCWQEPCIWRGQHVLSPAENGLLRESNALLMAVEKGEILARVLTGVAGEGAGYFALFDACPREDAVRKLMDEAAAWQKQAGSDLMTGPIAPAAVDLGGGVLCEGFEEAPAFNDAYNAPYYGEYLEACGFERETEWLAYRMEADRFERGKYRAISDRVKRRFGLSVRRDLVGRPREYARAVHFVMADEAGQESMNRLVGRMQGMLADGLCPVVFCGEEPVGFLLTVKGRRERARIVTLWVAEAWRRMGVTAVLFDAFMQGMDELKIADADASQVRADNLASRMGIEAAGGRVIHRYRRYLKRI